MSINNEINKLIGGEDLLEKSLKTKRELQKETCSFLSPSQLKELKEKITNMLGSINLKINKLIANKSNDIGQPQA